MVIYIGRRTLKRPAAFPGAVIGKNCPAGKRQPSCMEVVDRSDHPLSFSSRWSSAESFVAVRVTRCSMVSPG